MRRPKEAAGASASTTRRSSGPCSPVLLLTPDMVAVDANRAYERVSGRSLAQLLGRCIFDVFPDNPSRSPGQWSPGAARLAGAGARHRRPRHHGRAEVLRGRARPARRVRGRYWSTVNIPLRRRRPGDTHRPPRRGGHRADTRPAGTRRRTGRCYPSRRGRDDHQSVEPLPGTGGARRGVAQGPRPRARGRRHAAASHAAEYDAARPARGGRALPARDQLPQRVRRLVRPDRPRRATAGRGGR